MDLPEVRMERCLNSTKFALLAAVVFFFVASAAALADVEISVDKGICTQAFEILPFEYQSPPPARDIAHQTDFDRNSRPRVEFTDILPTTALDRSTTTNYYQYQSTGTQIPTAKVARELPAGPGGATLFLMGVGCIGAVKLGRSARGLHLQFLPEWYHTGGPIQVGGVTAINPSLTAPATVSISDLPAGQSIQLLLRRAVSLRLRSQCNPALATPRAPPHLGL